MTDITRPHSTKFLKIFGISLLSLVALAVVAVLALMLIVPIVYYDFYHRASDEFALAGLEDGLVPQGLAFLNDEELFLQCGYMTDETQPSRIYLVPLTAPYANTYVTLKYSDGTPFDGHTGGVSVWQDFVFVASDGEGEDNGIWVFSLTELLTAKNGESITAKDVFRPESRANYCFVDGDYLWVGEFYLYDNYLTDPTHAFQVDADSKQRALMCAYQLDASAPLGIVQKAPVMALSVPDMVQGAARADDGSFILSTSYSVSSSHIYVYENVLNNEPDSAIMINNTSVPVWYLNADALVQDNVAPPMAAEIVCFGDRVYISFESATDKYIFGHLIRGKYLYSLPIQ